MFHMNEIEDGEGRSISEELISFVSGIFFTSWFFIRMMRIGFGVGCKTVWLGIVV